MPAADDGLPRAAEQAALTVAALGRRVAIRARDLLVGLDTERGTSALLADADARRTAQRVSTAIMREIREGAAQMVDAGEQRAVDAAATAAASAPLDPKALGRIERAIESELRRAESLVRDGADEIRSQVLADVRARRDLPAVIEETQARIEGLFSRASSGIDAAVMAGGRSGKIEAAEATAEEPMGYLYLGPSRDSKIRPFCREHVGKVYTRAALDDLDNGPDQPKPVSVHMGGFNCRHIPSPITLEDARDQGYTVIT